VHGSIAHMRIVVSKPADLTSRVGEHLGWSDWHIVTQAEIDHFADATGNRIYGF
jgi:acyl dehydratase